VIAHLLISLKKFTGLPRWFTVLFSNQDSLPAQMVVKTALFD
jgi:hypothetical protein